MATLKLNKEFSTKNDACAFITGKPMTNNFRMEEVSSKYNIIFLQRGEASYTHKGVKKVTGQNRISADKVESHRANGNDFVLDIKKPVLIFVKTLHKNNKALTFYKFHGLFKIDSVTSLAGHLDYTVFSKIADDVTV